MLELHRYGTALLHVFALIPVFSKADVAILCEDCNGRRWLLCDFCKGQKTNIAEPLERGLAEDIENVYKPQCSFLQCRLILDGQNGTQIVSWMKCNSHNPWIKRKLQIL
ncbi:hypothetical protein D8674_008119 [Pyrus ussuriensis x Pyrus communis]|uniref:Uncharacterized protein n=1 Tax=Pyrus ussuriensis x Pyrus communis TaxID=2448454 RepID=A0A5N5HYT9_9ROSA|nr:hypothetical protein D8674_008119 [Pyrus ussuriensis x Pyrus communis]